MKGIATYVLEFIDSCHFVRKRNAFINNKLIATTGQLYKHKRFLLYQFHSQQKQGNAARQENVSQPGSKLLSKRFVLVISLLLVISFGVFNFPYKFKPLEFKQNEPVPSDKNNSAHEQANLSIAPRG